MTKLHCLILPLGLLFTALGWAAPSVTPQSPARTVLAPGGDISLSVSATGSGALSYQWLHKGKMIPGANASTLNLANAVYADSGWYLCDVTDSTGTTRSKALFVTVAPSVTQVRCWGFNAFGQTNVPADLDDAVAIAAGGSYTLAIRQNGTLVHWGSSLPNLNPDLNDFVAISGGPGHPMALRSNGQLVFFWDNYLGEAITPIGLENVVDIASGLYFSVALKSDGSVAVWGSNDFGQKNVPIGLSGVTAIAAGSGHVMALKNDGTVVAWGANFGGQSTVPEGLTNVVSIAAGDSHCLAVKADGTIVAWGGNYNGQTTIPIGLAGVGSLAAGQLHSLALKADGIVVGWGSDTYGESSVPSELAGVFAISAGNLSSAALRNAAGDGAPGIATQPFGATKIETEAVTLSVTANGTGPFTFQWRKGGVEIPGATQSTLQFDHLTIQDGGTYDVVVSNTLGSVTSAAAVLTVHPILRFTATGSKRQVIAPGGSAAFDVTVSGTGPISFQWVHNGRPLPGQTNSSLAIPAATLSDTGWYAVLVTDAYSTQRSVPFFLTVAPLVTEVIAWGTNFDGETNVPEDLDDAIAIAAGDQHMVALRRDGTVATWGRERLANPDDANAFSNLVTLYTKGKDTRAVKSDGTVVQWGNMADYSAVPADLTGVVGVAVTQSGTSVAWRSDGTAVRWGAGYSHGEQNMPTDLTGVVAVAGGNEHLLALRGDGTVVAWGSNSDGQSTVPVGLANVIAIAAGYNHSLALKSDGTVVAWGSNANGQNDVPVGLAQVVAIADGIASLAVKSDGTVVAWGSGTPVPVGLDQVLTVSTWGWNGLALRAPTVQPPVFSGQPVAQSIVLGQGAVFTVAINGLPLPVAQWQRKLDGVWQDIHDDTLWSGTATQVLTITPAAAASLGGAQFRCRATNAAGAAVSDEATLTVLVPAIDPQVQIEKLHQRLLLRAATVEELYAYGQALANNTSSLAAIYEALLAAPSYQAREKERAIRLYYATFNRMPDQMGLDYWSDVLAGGGMTPTQVATAFAQSDEFRTTYGELPGAAFIAQMYRNTLGRDPDLDGLNYWVNQMNLGMTRGQLLLAFADSQEFRDRMAPEVEVVRLYHLLLDRMPAPEELNNWRGFLRGYDQTETLLESTEFGNLHPEGITQAQFVEAVFQGFLLREADSSTRNYFAGLLTGGSLTRPELIHQVMEMGEFRTTVVPVTRHYLAVFLRAPDLVGSTHWTNQMRTGLGFTQLSQVFANSAEFASSYAGLTDTQFVSQMYLNILGRPADAGGLAHWVNLFATGQSDEAGLLLSFVLSWEAGWRFAPDIRTIGHYQAFYGRSPTNTELIFWKDYLTSLPAQFRQELLESAEFNDSQ